MTNQPSLGTHDGVAGTHDSDGTADEHRTSHDAPPATPDTGRPAHDVGRTMQAASRVRLRRLEVRDLDAWVRWLGDREVAKFVLPSGQVFRRSDAEVFWVQAEGSRTERLFAIEAGDGRLIGLVTLHKIAPDRSRCELGIVIGEPEYRGRGLGSAAIAEALRIAFDELRLASVALRVAAGNTRAIASYERLGFTVRHRFPQRLSVDGYPDDELFMVLEPLTDGPASTHNQEPGV